ncbi:MAG: hypothetical protein R6X15_01775 [Pseudomonadota bacterium]
MNRLWPGFIALLALMLLAGCSSKPTDEEVREQVTGRLEQEYGTPIFEVVNFAKVNGIPRDRNTYFAEVEYDLRFKVGLDKAATALQQEGENLFTAGLKAAALGVTYGDFKAGDMLHKKERVRFVRAEKGWLIDEETSEK